MADPRERPFRRQDGLDLSAVFWALVAWTCVSLAFAVSMILSESANAQTLSDEQAGAVTRIVDITQNEGVVDLRPTGRVTSLPIPRFVSMRSGKTNMRVGPGIEFELRAVYSRKGLPLQIVAESGHWREVQDWEGTRGWVHKDLLSSRRMARVSEDWTSLRRQPDDQSTALAELAIGVLTHLKSCLGEWCIVQVDDLSGWLPRNHFFGAYSHEDFG